MMTKTVFKRLDNMSDMIQERVGFQRMNSMADLEFDERNGSKLHGNGQF